MSTEEFETADELDDAFEAHMEWLERKASLEKAIEYAERHVEYCSAELTEAEISLQEAIIELDQHLEAEPQ